MISVEKNEENMTKEQIDQLRRAADAVMDANRAADAAHFRKQDAEEHFSKLLDSFAEPTRGRPRGSKNKTAESGSLPLEGQ